MQWDLVLIGAVLVGIVWGAWRGFALQMGVVLSILLGVLYAPSLAAWLAEWMREDRLVLQLLLFVLSYAGISLACFLAAFAAKGMLRKAELGGFDRHMGGFMGAVHGWLLGCLALVVVLLVLPSARSSVLERPAGQAFSRTLQVVRESLPDRAREVVTPLLPSEENPGR